MEFLNNSKNSNLWRFGWHYIFIILIIIAFLLQIISTVLTTNEFNQTSQNIQTAAYIGFSAALFIGLFGLLVLMYENVRSTKINGEKLDNAVEMINRNRSLLGKISQGVRLSNSAKEIAFRDHEQMELAEAVLTKVHQHDFEVADAMIKAMTARPEYQALSEQLTRTAAKYRNATEEQRIEQIISHIENLSSQFHWAQAAAQIENLIKTFPYSDKAKAMSKRLQEKKDKRKMVLLAAWDEAVKSKDTDKSLEILKELDMYLTPTEGLALQESASTVFRTKLHNLGVQFSLAVTEQRWNDALDAGRQIASDFPNSRMAQEIRGKMDVLQERAKQS